MSDQPDTQPWRKLFSPTTPANSRLPSNQPVEGKQHICGSTDLVELGDSGQLFCIDCQYPASAKDITDAPTA